MLGLKKYGSAGTTLVIKDDILEKTGRNIPTMLDYKTHINKDSMFNTPPVFAIYVSMLTLKWLKKRGGIDQIEKNNNEKLIYYILKLIETNCSKERQM